VIHLPSTFPSLKFKEIVKQAGKKWRGSGKRKFLQETHRVSFSVFGIDFYGHFY